MDGKQIGAFHAFACAKNAGAKTIIKQRLFNLHLDQLALFLYHHD